MSTLSSLTSAQLKRAAAIQEQIEALNGQLASILDGDAITSTTESAPTKPPGKGKFTPAGLERLRAAQKARWAKIKAPKKADATAVPEEKKRRKMSASARAKIAAAQKARWAKFHAGK